MDFSLLNTVFRHGMLPHLYDNFSKSEFASLTKALADNADKGKNKNCIFVCLFVRFDPLKLSSQE